jgi:hypothetical protein
METEPVSEMCSFVFYGIPVDEQSKKIPVILKPTLVFITLT